MHQRNWMMIWIRIGLKRVKVEMMMLQLLLLPKKEGMRNLLPKKKLRLNKYQ